METILVLYAAIGLLLILVAIPLIRKKIKPNHLYGFRVPQTLNDPEVWYATNAHAGKRMVAAGICTALAAIGFYYVPGITVDAYAWAAGGLCFGVRHRYGAELAVHEYACQMITRTFLDLATGNRLEGPWSGL